MERSCASLKILARLWEVIALNSESKLEVVGLHPSAICKNEIAFARLAYLLISSTVSASHSTEPYIELAGSVGFGLVRIVQDATFYLSEEEHVVISEVLRVIRQNEVEGIISANNVHRFITERLLSRLLRVGARNQIIGEDCVSRIHDGIKQFLDRTSQRSFLSKRWNEL